MPRESSNPPAPYASFGVFGATIEQLKQATVPSGPLDRHVLHGLSGADYGSLMSALRFFGFIDDERKATPAYRALVDVWNNPPQFKELLLKHITERYKPIIGSVNLESGTLNEVEKAFKEYGVSQGQMLTKTVRFLVKALTDCGVNVSPYILKTKATRAPAPRNGVVKTRRPKHTPTDKFANRETGDQLPDGMERLPIPGLAEAYIQYPADLTDAHCDLFTAMIGVLRTYVKGRTGGKAGKP